MAFDQEKMGKRCWVCAVVLALLIYPGFLCLDLSQG